MEIKIQNSSDTVRILGIAGSIREGSYNQAVLKAATSLAPEHVDFEVFDQLEAIPPFNQDKESNPPKEVIALKDKIKSADAILIATPEYNYSIPGVLKNAIDWASRPYGENAWEGKPVGVMSASIGMLGGARAQYQLRQIFVFLNMHPLNQPEVIIPDIAEKVDASGTINDKHTKKKIAEILDGLVKWTITLRTGEEISEKITEKADYESAYGRMVS